MLPALFSLLGISLPLVSAAVTVYAPLGNSAPTSTQASAAAAPTSSVYTGLLAYDPNLLTPPTPPAGQTFPFIQLRTGGMPGLSINQKGDFLGFSIELSIADTLLGETGQTLRPIFLNLMANLQQRGGGVVARVGGNTQEEATLIDGPLPNNRSIFKLNSAGTTGTTESPKLDWSVDLLYTMSNISALVNMKWFTGIPFNDTSNFTRAFDTAEWSERVLGNNLIGMQLGNEPDLYHLNLHRDPNYDQAAYMTDFANAVNLLNQDSNLPTKNKLVGPSTCCQWTAQSVIDLGYLDQFNSELTALAIQYYPDDNCPTTGPHDIPTIFPEYLKHSTIVNNLQQFVSASQAAQAHNKPFIIFETNTASCGGFVGISDSFGAGLWGVDFALQFAFINATTALMHIGGQNTTYNPFTPPPTGQGGVRQWTIGPIYYSALIVAEALGSSGNAQVVDVTPQLTAGGNDFTPVYAIYENGAPARMVVINYNNDPSGASDYNMQFAIGGTGVNQANATPQQVTVKYFTASSVAQKGNLMWANQTFGGYFESDGRPVGDMATTTIQCNTGANTCTVPVKAPSLALIFLTPAALTESSPSTDAKTFATTVTENTLHNTATIDQAVLATSNGRGGSNMNQIGGSTSPGSASAGVRNAVLSQAMVGVVAVAMGAALVGRTMMLR